MPTKRRAITLVEILVVIAIIAVLVALLTPTVRQAMHRSQDGVVTSNLSQVSKALLLYAQEHDDLLPDYATAVATLPQEVLCDPADHWRNGCSGPAEQPRVGSFGYVRGLEGLRFSVQDDQVHDGDYSRILITQPKHAMVLSIFRADQVPDEYPYDLCIPTAPTNCLMPERVLVGYVDGSVGLRQFQVVMGNGDRRLMSWSSMLLSDPTKPLVEVKP